MKFSFASFASFAVQDWVAIKLSSAPKPSRGFWSGIGDLNPSAAYVVYPGKERYPLGQGVEALPVSMLGEVLHDY